jgi:regulator of protease activity HflC (stomatin/prohibitin superfamily)
MDNERTTALGVGGGAALLLLLVLGLMSVKIVSAGHVGVVTTWGAVNVNTLAPGFHLVVPVAQDVHQVSTQVQAHSFQQIDAASQELQSVKLTGKVNFSVDPRKASTLYQDVGLNFADKLLDPTFNDFIKTIVPNFAVNDILKNRDAIRDQTAKRLENTVAPYGLHIVAVQITDIRFSAEFEKAIEAKQVAQQQVAQAQQALEKAKIDAQTAVTAARGQAEANSVLDRSATPGVLQLKAIEKWNGVMPLSTSGTPLLQLPTR